MPSPHLAIVAHMLDELQDSEERSAMTRQLLEDGVEGADKFEEDFGAWVDDARDASRMATSCLDCTVALSRRLDALVKQSQNLASACIYIITGGDNDNGGYDTASGAGPWWWYEDEIAKKDGSVDPVQARVLQMMHFFGLTDFVRDLICLAVLDPCADIASSDAARYEPFHALTLTKSYDLIDRIDMTLGGSLSPFLQFCGGWGFASKVLPDSLELQEGFKFGYGDVAEELANPDIGTLLHAFVESDSGRRTPNRSWEVCAASAAILKLGGSLQALNSENQTAMSLASTTDGVVFGYFVRALLGSTRVAWGGGRPVGGGASDDAGAGESKDAATKAEVQALRDELRDTKRQMGNILLLFGKLLGLQQEGHQQLEQRTRTRTAQQSMETKTEPQADSDNESANSSASDEELGDEEDDIAII